MKYTPHLDPSFLPMIEYERRYCAAAEEAGAQDCVLTLVKNSKQVAQQKTKVSLAPQLRSQTLEYLERLIKSMLWVYGGYALYTNLPETWVRELQEIFSSSGPQKFDAEFIVEGIFAKKFGIHSTKLENIPAEQTESTQIGGKSGGQRLGFDVGGSDKKIAAISDNQVLFADSIIWDPYPQTDISWHKREIKELYALGASKLPQAAEAIGGSAPGIIMDNEVKVGSLFRGLSGAQREESRNVFATIAREVFGEIPFRLANDGDVTALAGAMLLKKNNLLGIAMGTSEAAGYANPAGAINSWFSELAFVPVDMGAERAQDEWSQDWGTGVEYFSQQAVIRLAPKVGITLPEGLAKPKKLALVQEHLKEGHEGAALIYRTIGCYLGYSLPWYHKFYGMQNVLLLGRVLKGEGGRLIISEAEKILAEEFPELSLALFTLSDEEILHGQAMAAASLA